MDTYDQIKRFLGARVFGVIGASADPAKYGHKVFAAFVRRGRRVYPINPNAAAILGHPAHPNVASVPEPIEAVSIVTPPAVTERALDDVIAAGIRHVWMQPGAESPEAIRKARDAGLNVIAGGPCVLVELGAA
jgi:predicted CoA-binding protein